jgi:hypothetical protein
MAMAIVTFPFVAQGSADSGGVKIAIALIAAAASVAVSIISALLALRATKKAEMLRANLAAAAAERDARRDYEYEARKRLYAQFEPLLFQLIEHSDNALHRIYSLARTARQGNLVPGEGWLWAVTSRNYYAVSTLYKLITPAVHFRLMQSRLTLSDLTVDPEINMQYAIAKQIYIAITDDFEVARLGTVKLPYDPNSDRADELRQGDPRSYWRQGLFVGWLDRLLDALIISDSNGTPRCMRYGEFESAYNSDALSAAVAPWAEIFLNFHPRERPILWRILLAQAHLYEALLRVRELKVEGTSAKGVSLLAPIQGDKRNVYDWRSPPETSAPLDSASFEAAWEYICLHLPAFVPGQ